MVVAGIDVVPDRAVDVATSAIANVTTPNSSPVAEIIIRKVLSVVCPRRRVLVSAKLTGIEALPLTSLSGSNLAVRTQLALAVRISLAALSRLSILAGWLVGASRARHGLNLISQLLDLIHQLGLILLVATFFPWLR